MTDFTMPAQKPATPYSQRFRPAANRVNLTTDQRRRQARVTGLAWTVIGSREGVMGFFNHHCEKLGGRPLDLALSSDEGLHVVESELNDLQNRRLSTGARGDRLPVS